MTRWQKFRLVVKVVELRLRFIALMAVTGLVFAYWDTLWNRYDKWMRPAAEQHAAVSGIEYYCPMHPQVVQDEPGSCPICGMPLARRKKGEKATLPEGVTARVAAGPVPRRAGRHRDGRGRLCPADGDPDDRRQRRLRRAAAGHDRLEGRRQVAGREAPRQLHRQGGARRASRWPSSTAPSCTRRSRSCSPPPGARSRTRVGRCRPPRAARCSGDRRELVRLSAEKLRRWGITQAQIDEILAKGKSDFTIPILAPIGGTVVKKNVVEGQEVPEGFPMFEIADLSRVWVQAQVFEHQMGLVREGQAVEATVEAYPGRTFRGTVEFIQPTLDPATRTVEVRFDLENPGHRAPARHVRHGDAEDAGGRDARLPGRARRGSPAGSRGPPRRA